MVGALVPFCGHIIIRDMSFARLVLFVALLTTTALPVLAQSADPIIAAVEAEDWQRARSEIGSRRCRHRGVRGVPAGTYVTKSLVQRWVPSPIVASLREVSWNLTVWPYTSARVKPPFHCAGAGSITLMG